MIARGRFPNLLVIGAMKCGTTSLHDYLSLHPEIFMSHPKEIHYYADENFHRMDANTYKSFFKTDLPIAGTSPQSYTKCHNKFYKNIPERIYSDTPDVKLIYILRNPIERYKSHILESYHCDPPGDVAYSKKSDNYMKTGLYGMQLKAYLDYFSIEQIHLLTLEELQENPKKTLNEIFRFLDVAEMQDESLFDFVRNSAESKTIPWAVKNKLWLRLVKKLNAPLHLKLASLTTEKFFAEQTQKPILSTEEIARLRQIYRQDTRMLEELSGQSFRKWKL